MAQALALYTPFLSRGLELMKINLTKIFLNTHLAQ